MEAHRGGSSSTGDGAGDGGTAERPLHSGPWQSDVGTAGKCRAGTTANTPATTCGITGAGNMPLPAGTRALLCIPPQTT